MDEDGEAINEDHPKASSICAIDRKSVHRICSGQVVLTLATAVKELLENSIDAGATIVDIKLKEYGSELIEVSDNGMGVHPLNFEGLTLKHHTSKLRDFGDLINVDTFGFRGEALSSLCALCDMTVTTRHTDEAVGTKLEFDHNGKITKQEAQAKQFGTKVVLQNLFYTLPVRHKEFQRNLKKDFAKMVQVLNSYCIISTGVRITCTNITSKGSRSTVVASQGNSLLQENISNIFGPKQVQSLLEFKQKMPGEDVCTEYGLKGNAPSLFKIEGFVSKCEHGLGRSSTDRQFLFINGRPFDSPKLVKVINEAYHQYNRHQYPFVVLKIDVNKDGVDVNVTPDKRQVFMEGEKILLATVKSSLSAMFTSTISLLQMHQPSMVTKLVKSRSEPCDDRLRLTSETPINKANTMVSTLSKLKRSFSSAFAKPDIICSNFPQSPSISSPLSKQRRMDIFVRKGLSPDSRNNGSSGHPIQLHENLLQSSPDKELETVKFDCVPSGDCVDVDDVDIQNGKLNIITIDASGDHHCTSMNGSDVDSGEIQNGKHSDNSIDSVDQNVGKLAVHSYRGNGSLDTEVAGTDSTEIDQTTTKSDLNDDSVRMSERTRIESRNYQEMIIESKDYNKDLLGSNISLDKSNNAVETRASMECIEVRDSPITRIPHEACEDKDQNEDVDEEEGLVKAESQIAFSFEQFRKKWKNRCTENSQDTFSRAFRAKINPSDNQAAEQELQKEIKKESFSQMEVLGQFNKGFIITKLGNDLFIVDQHATDEKYNFETLQRDTVIQSQKLIAPLNLELTASNETILVDNIDIFKKNGFEFMIDEAGLPTQRVKLSSTPVSKNWNFGKEDIEEMVFMLTDSPGVMCRPSRVRAMFASRACRKSIMIGTVLNTAEMKKLLCHMGEIEQPWNCPHGRPTMRHLINLDMIPR